ncbi:MAG TPA: hypothetical protein VIM79_25540, partial [Niastella sp.]
SGNAAYSFLKGFKASLAYQHSIYSKSDEQLHKLGSFFTRDLVNQYSQLDSSGKVVSWPVPRGDIFGGNDVTARISNLRAQLDYSLSKKNVAVAALAGIDRRSFDLKGKEYTIYGKNLPAGSFTMNYDSMYTLSSGARSKIPKPIQPYDSADHFFSYYGSAFVTFKDRYTFSANVRRDWSNRFSPGLNRKGIGLWSVGMGWNIDKEPFFKSNFINKLKLRASYGVNGNIDYSIIPTHSIQSVNNGEVYTYATPSTQQIGWEKTSMLNVGIDIKNRFITSSIDYYLKQGSDLLQYSPRNPVTGTSIVKDNSGSLKGKGLDVDLQIKPIGISKKISYSTGFILAHSTNKTTSNSGIKKAASEMIDPYAYAPIKGYPADALFAYRFAGLSSTNGAPVGYIKGDTSTNYTKIMGETDGSSLQYVGSAVPTTGINWVNSIHFMERWSLSAMISGRFGYWVRKPALNYANILDGIGGEAPGFNSRWQKAGDEKITSIPKLDFPANNNNYNNAMAFYEGSRANVVEGDHIRLQYVQIAYQYEKGEHAKFPFQRLECFLTASNLGIIYRKNKDNIDPDVPLNGYPAGRSLTLTLKLSY